MEKEIRLQHPIEYNGVKYDKLVIKSFKAKHFRLLPDELLDLEGGDFDSLPKSEKTKLSFKMLPLIASMAEVPETVVEELELADIMAVMGEFSDFLGQSLSVTTGKN